MTTKELFLSTVQLGLKSAELITDPSQKAVAYAELAKAIAMTGNVRSEETASNTKTKDSLKKESSKKKTSKKDKVEEVEPVPAVEETEALTATEEIVVEPVQAEEPSVEDQAPIPVEETVEPVEVESTEEAVEEVSTEEEPEIDAETAEAYEYVQWLIESFEVDQLEAFLSYFTQGELTSISDLNPDNIKGYAAFMKAEIARQNGAE